jgi:hypothetical protein
VVRATPYVTRAARRRAKLMRARSRSSRPARLSWSLRGNVGSAELRIVRVVRGRTKLVASAHVTGRRGDRTLVSVLGARRLAPPGTYRVELTAVAEDRRSPAARARFKLLR